MFLFIEPRKNRLWARVESLSDASSYLFIYFAQPCSLMLNMDF